MVIKNKNFPTIADIDISKIPDQEIGKSMISDYLKLFLMMSEEGRKKLQKDIKNNRTVMVDHVKGLLFKKSPSEAFSSENPKGNVLDLAGTAQGIVDAIQLVLEKQCA